MGEIRHRRNGSIIDEPRNWEGLEIRLNFVKNRDKVNINIARLEFAGKEALKIRERVMDGQYGGLGCFEADPYGVEYGEIGGDTDEFEGYLDYSDKVEFIGCSGVAVSLKKEQGGDWLNDVADGFSFRYLYDIGVIKKSDFVKVPYVINYIPDNMQMIVLGMSIFMITKELVNTTRLLAEAVGDAVNAATPNVGLGVTMDLGDALLIVIKLAAYIVYTIALIKAIKKLIEELIEQIMPPIRHHLGISIYTLFERACQHLGLKFESDLISARKDWVVIPPKDNKGGKKPKHADKNWKELGIGKTNNVIDTFGGLIRTFIEGFNADYRIENGVLRFERMDYWKNRGTYVVPNFFVDQKELRDVYTLNSDELLANYSVEWATDGQDMNTLDNQKGRIFQVITEPKRVQNKKMVIMKGIKEVNLPFSLGVRKENLTDIEKVFKKLAKVVDKVTGILGGGTSYVSKINRRKGVLMTSTHYFTTHKMVVMRGSKLARGQREILSSRKLWEELHFINSFAEHNKEHSQFKIIKNHKVPFCYKSLIKLLNSPDCRTHDGKEAILEGLKWKTWEDTAVLDYRIKELYNKNLKLKFVE